MLGSYIHEVLEHWREGLDIIEVSKLFESKYPLADEEKGAVSGLLDCAKKFYEPYVGLMAESELKLEHPLLDSTGKQIVIDGIIDKLYHLVDGKFVLVDFKTGRSKQDNQLQMKFYFYLLSRIRKVPAADMLGKVFYLRMEQQQTYNVDEGDLNEFENWLLTINEMVERTDKFTHSFSSLCRFCQYRNGDCQPYQIKRDKYQV
jgi:CRISPR/Cas system-associated exonuclease Cas4 (RecB family)